MLKNKVECDRERCLAGISALHSMYTPYTGGGGRGKKEAPKKIRRYANVAYYENAQWTNLIAPQKAAKWPFFTTESSGPGSYKTKEENKAIAHSLGDPET